MLDFDKEPFEVGDELIDKWGTIGKVEKKFYMIDWVTPEGRWHLSSSLIVAFQLRKVKK